MTYVKYNMSHSVFQCYYQGCMKLFQNKVYLVTHINSQHLQIKAFRCEMCGQIVSSEEEYLIHYEKCSSKHQTTPKSSGLFSNFTLSPPSKYIPPSLLNLPVLPAIEKDRSRCAFQYKLPMTVRVFDLLHSHRQSEHK